MSVLTVDIIRERHVQSLLDLADAAIPSLRIAMNGPRILCDHS